MATTKNALMRQDVGYINALSYGTNLDDTTLQAAVDDIGSAEVTLMLTPGVWTIADDLTIPANITLHRAQGATISVNAGRTLTIQGQILDDGSAFAATGRAWKSGSGLLTVTGHAEASLPTPAARGRLAAVNDQYHGLAMDSGVRWAEVGPRMVNVKSLRGLGGDGTVGSPWSGWETYLNALGPGCSIYFPDVAGSVGPRYRQTSQVTMKEGWRVFGDNPERCRIDVDGAIKGWVYAGASLTTHANVEMRDLGIYGNGSTTLSLIEVDKGFNFYFNHLYLFSSSTNGLQATGFIGLDVTRCNIEGNVLCGLRLGGATAATQYATCYSISACIFGSSDDISSDGFVTLTNASTGFIGDHTTFEHGTYDVVLDGVTDLVMDDLFMEHATQGCFKSLGVCQRIAMRNSHVHNAKQGARVDLDFSDGTDAHEQLRFEDNRHVVFGGSGHTSVTLFNPGDAKSYRYWGNITEPAGNRTIIPVTYVTGYLSDDQPTFAKDVEKFDPDYGVAVVNPGFRFGLAGTSHLKYDQDTNELQLEAVQNTESLKLKGAASHILLEDLAATVTIGGQDTIALVNDGSMSLEERLFVQRNQAPVAGGEAAILFGHAAARPGFYWGSGAPTVAAALNSIYVRTDGGANARLYVNTNGSTTWLAVPLGE